MPPRVALSAVGMPPHPPPAARSPPPRARSHMATTSRPFAGVAPLRRPVAPSAVGTRSPPPRARSHTRITAEVTVAVRVLAHCGRASRGRERRGSVRRAVVVVAGSQRARVAAVITVAVIVVAVRVLVRCGRASRGRERRGRVRHGRVRRSHARRGPLGPWSSWPCVWPCASWPRAVTTSVVVRTRPWLWQPPSPRPRPSSFDRGSSLGCHRRQERRRPPRPRPPPRPIPPVARRRHGGRCSRVFLC